MRPPLFQMPPLFQIPVASFQKKKAAATIFLAQTSPGPGAGASITWAPTGCGVVEEDEVVFYLQKNGIFIKMEDLTT